MFFIWGLIINLNIKKIKNGCSIIFFCVYLRKFFAMSWLAIVLLVLLGLAAIILEIIVVPGGVVGILGVLTIAAGVVGAYLSHGTIAGHVTLAVTLIVVVVGLIFSIRGKTWRKLMLNTQIDKKMNEIDQNKLQVGAVGISLSRLAPMGKANFNGEIVEVASYQDFIDENKQIVIIKIDENKIIVKLNS